nr:allophanate hydrolase subunit 1 [Pseudonocardia spinosispora]
MLPCGESGLLLELTSSAQVTAVYRALHSACDDGRLHGVRELVPAARTVLVAAEDGSTPPRERVGELIADLGDLDHLGSPSETPAEVTIPVRYDGEDLDLVARTAELSVAEVVELHSGAEYTVAFCGFAPGFGYLTGLPEPLQQARLDDSRSRIPAGSVGVAGEFSAVYPRSSPGGWRLIGRTEQVMFDPAADPPARLSPGDIVRFEPVG